MTLKTTVFFVLLSDVSSKGADSELITMSGPTKTIMLEMGVKHAAREPDQARKRVFFQPAR